ncbi:MAG: GIY-YIG nuclease family protein [Marinobacter sp.]
MRSGYIYVLVHPSDPDLYKIGITTRRPEHRLTEHNSNFEEYTGQIVKETGQKWELKEFHAVSDPYWAESVFWGTTPFADIPYRYGVEVERMGWDQVQTGLDAAKKAGVRPGPGPLPDHVYAYTASIRKRLEGRGITLLGNVRSITSGKANFRCSNGHKWRAKPSLVGEGQGCPECGIGERDPEEIRQRIKAGVICLLTHPDEPGFVNIGLGYGTLEEVCRKRPWGCWETHRYRNVEEVALAESLIWELLGVPLPHDRKPIKIDLKLAEDAFRKLIYAMQKEIALAEKAKESASKMI